jgi:hypothetical protein
VSPTRPRWEKDPERQPERLEVQRGELGRKEEKPCPIYGPRDSYDYRCHAVYVAWQEGEITAKEAQRRAWQIEKEYRGRR